MNGVITKCPACLREQRALTKQYGAHSVKYSSNVEDDVRHYKTGPKEPWLCQGRTEFLPELAPSIGDADRRRVAPSRQRAFQEL